MTKHVCLKPRETLQRSEQLTHHSHLVVLVEAGHGASVGVVAVCVRWVVGEVLLSLVGRVGGHPLLHALVDLLLVHLTSAGVDVRLQATHAAAKGRGVSCKTIGTI